MRNKKKLLDFEINLLPCISMLSVCVCSLLLAAVFQQIGAMNVKQAIGGQSKAETEKRPQLWVLLGERGDLTLTLKEASRAARRLGSMKLKGLDGRNNLDQLGQVLEKIKTAEPTLTTVLIQPRLHSEYEEIINLMDEFKKGGLTDLGVVPL